MKPSEEQDILCTVVFRLKKGQADAGRFVYSLACRVEQWKDVEVLSLSVGDLEYRLGQGSDENNKGSSEESRDEQA